SSPCLLPPSPSLFPSTTLFRSPIPQPGQRIPHIIGGLRKHRLQRAEQLHAKARETRRSLGESGVCHATQVSREHRRPAHGPGFEDRKSTRLNSSHLGISYAVFC